MRGRKQAPKKRPGEAWAASEAATTPDAQVPGLCMDVISFYVMAYFSDEIRFRAQHLSKFVNSCYERAVGDIAANSMCLLPETHNTVLVIDRDCIPSLRSLACARFDRDVGAAAAAVVTWRGDNIQRFVLRRSCF